MTRLFWSERKLGSDGMWDGGRWRREGRSRDREQVLSTLDLMILLLLEIEDRGNGVVYPAVSGVMD
jgi:hypothetical protein